MERPLQTKELAMLLNVPQRQVVEWAVAGLLPSLNEGVGRGNSRLYSPDAVDRGRLLSHLNKAGIRTRDLRKLVPIIEAALKEKFTLTVPHPVTVGNRLYTLCRLPMQGPVLIEGVPPGQTVIPLLALNNITPEERRRAADEK
jgi:DNA-binding transcriptional MerR regulator